MKIKICGITNVDDALCVRDAGADMIGMIFADSPRQIDRARASEIARAMNGAVDLVGVFVNADTETILQHVRDCALTYVQLHGAETPEQCRELSIAVKVIKACSVKTLADSACLSAYQDSDAFLLDTASGGQTGGTGKAFDWSIAVAVRSAYAVPLIVAGGLHPDNVRHAIDQVHPWGIDASSLLEVSPGLKDHERVKRFIHVART